MRIQAAVLFKGAVLEAAIDGLEHTVASKI